VTGSGASTTTTKHTSKMNENQARVPAGSPEGGEFVSEGGSPVTFYHGTGAVFSQFNDPGKGKGIDLTTDRQTAADYAGISTRYTGQTPHVVEAHVKITKDGSQRLNQLGHLGAQERVERLKSEGYDGFKSGSIVTVFSGKQVVIRKVT
jgi:hypothetical protein